MTNCTGDVAVGLNFCFVRREGETVVDLDSAASRPVAADGDYLYGIYGDKATSEFWGRQANVEMDRRERANDHCKVLVRVPHNAKAIFDPSIGLKGLSYLGLNCRADFRKAFQTIFCQVVEERYGNTDALRSVRDCDTQRGFLEAVTVFPECIAEAISRTDVVVAVLPMLLCFDLELPVAIIAKKVVKDLLWSIDSKWQLNQTYQFKQADGRDEILVPPLLVREQIVTSLRPGAIWRQGQHHPSNTAARVP